MPAPDELYPPAQYEMWWLLIALGVLALVVLAAWLITLLTRTKTTVAAAAGDANVPLAPDNVIAVLRNEYLEKIAQIELAYWSGELSDRQLSAELSRTVRTFANEYSGIEAPVLALRDLEQRGVHPSLLGALRHHYYPSIFRRHASVDPDASVAAARNVVSTWY
ncbi:hypothetical protein [Microbacterium sp. YY-01]|uniref:hypothetical protein n=1 Tax=Microbacterium sp. YY-01 TaxID=3421634 RepID=UPI003D183AB5